MGDTANGSCEYRIEVSGWGLDGSFFVENTQLVWTEAGEKKLRLRRCFAEGAVIFVRLLGSDPTLGSVPVAYQVENVQPMNRLGLCEMDLHEVYPRCRPAEPGPAKSDEQGDSLRTSKMRQEDKPTRSEEILHEA